MLDEMNLFGRAAARSIRGPPIDELLKIDETIDVRVDLVKAYMQFLSGHARVEPLQQAREFSVIQAVVAVAVGYGEFLLQFAAARGVSEDCLIHGLLP
jgi:hypothetical protein